MDMMRAALVGLLALAPASAAFAEAPNSQITTTYRGQAVAPAPWLHAQQPTPLFVVGGVAGGIWTHVSPPYNVAANRNLAANPIW
jgi:hypothetical protein